MTSRIRAFGAFWYDFVIGDDWRVAGGVALALAVTFWLAKVSDAPVWWIVPAAIVVLLPLSLRREVRRLSPSAAEPGE